MKRLRSCLMSFAAPVIAVSFVVPLLNPAVALATACPAANVSPCWTTQTPMSIVRRDFGMAADSQGRIYTAGGFDGANFLSNVEMYNPVTQTWTTKAPMPAGRNDFGFAFNTSNNRFYAGGGYDGGNLREDFLEYNPVTNTWTTLEPLLSARAGVRLAASTNGKIYAIGGCYLNGDCATNTEEYDPTTGHWLAKSALPVQVADHSLVTAPNGKIYLFGGGGYPSGVPTISNQMFEYNPATDIWTQKASADTARSNAAAVVNLAGNIYLIGGTDSLTTQHYLTSIQEYRPTTNTWTDRPDLPVAVFGAGAALGSDLRLHVMGGQTLENAATNTNYASRITFSLW